MAVDLQRVEIIIGAQAENIIDRLLGEVKTRLTMMIEGGRMTQEAAIAVLLEDLRTGGRTFGAYKNGMRNIGANAVRGATNEAIIDRYRETGIELFRWVTVSGNPCPQCDDRQGQVETLQFWEDAGFPKSGFSVCQDNCKCIILPEGFESEQLKADGFLVKL